MKFSLRFLAFALGSGLMLAAPTVAHAQVSVGVQIGAPAWGPPVPQGTQYYYIPEIDGYYDIYNQVYIVFDGQQWVQQPYLDGYDPYYFHPYPVSYVGPQPWLYIGTYRSRYPQYVTNWRRGGYGGGGAYYGREYGAGRVYGYGGGGGFGRPGYNGYGDRGGVGRAGYPSHGGGFGDWRGQPGGNQPQPGGGNFPGGQPGGGGRGGFPGGQPGGGRIMQDGGRGGFQGGQPGGGRSFGGGHPGGGGQPGGGQPGGGGGQPGGGGRGRR